MNSGTSYLMKQIEEILYLLCLIPNITSLTNFHTYKYGTLLILTFPLNHAVPTPPWILLKFIFIKLFIMM